MSNETLGPLLGIVIAVLLAVIGACLVLIVRRNKDLAEAKSRLAEESAARKRAEERLELSEQLSRGLSISDELTGLSNARHFQRQIQAEADRAVRYNRALSLLLMDLDGFQAFNDAHGRQEGDRLLAFLAQLLQECIRDTDSTYRYGEGKFAVILPETGGDDALHMAERIRRMVDETPVALKDGGQAHMTMSIGLALFRPDESVEVLISRADQLMYLAKQQGKNRVCAED
jgi:diguanylate cyclase (GGDEF)-like protein